MPEYLYDTTYLVTARITAASSAEAISKLADLIPAPSSTDDVIFGEMDLRRAELVSVDDNPVYPSRPYTGDRP